MAPTKELTQPIAAVTREVTEEMISDKKIPPLQTRKTLNQTNAKTNKAHDNKHENQRVIGNGADKRADPRDGTSDNRTNVTNDSGERTSSRSTRR